MLRVAILGAGLMGRTHARAYARLSDVEVAGVSSRSAERARALALEVGAEPFTDFLALAADPRVDAVSVALPAHLHAEATLAALRAGKHVLVEKPMALSVSECDAMIAAARRAQRVIMVGHTLRFWPEYVAIVSLVQSGALGRPVSATASRLLGQSTSPVIVGQDAAAKAPATDMVLELHIHDLDLFNWLLGPPTAVFARGIRGRGDGWEHALTILDYTQASVFAEASALRPAGFPFTMTFAVLCENGAVEYAFRAGGVQVDSRESGDSRLTVYEPGKPPHPLPAQPGDAYENEIAAFVRCIQEGVQPENGTGEQGRLAVRLALAVRESLESGVAVAL